MAEEEKKPFHKGARPDHGSGSWYQLSYSGSALRVYLLLIEAIPVWLLLPAMKTRQKNSSINWKGISTGIGTLVFLMGVENLTILFPA